MKSFTLAAIVASGLAAPAWAQAPQDGSDPQRGVYATLGYGRLDWESVDLGFLEGRFGYRFNRWLGVEAEGGVGVDGETVRTGGLPPTVKYDPQYKAAVYGVAFLPLGGDTDLLARAGYGTTKIDHPGRGGGHDKAESWNLGVGAQHRFDDKNGVRIDYTHQSRDDASGGGRSDVWSVAYTRRF